MWPRLGTALAWAFLSLILLFLYGPLVPPAIRSFAGLPGGAGMFRHYTAIFEDARLMQALQTSLVVGLLVALITPPLWRSGSPGPKSAASG
jgi:spermidine/putrescine transport system permease protein